jgi:hypothetical protein
VPFVDAFDFAVLAGLAYALRKNPAAHKRLIIIATAGISGAAFFRWHVAILFHDGYAADAAWYVFLLLLATYDLWSTHRIHRATVRRQLYGPVVLPQIEMLPNNFAIFCPKSNVVRYENLSTSRSFLRDSYAGW